MTASCARCGDCCDPVVLTIGMARALDAGHGDEASTEFARAHWRLRQEQPDPTSRHYTCDRFDPDSRLCTAHEDRPPVCSGFPWYGRVPMAGPLVNPRCSFQWDLPSHQRPAGAWPLIPLTVINHQHAPDTDRTDDQPDDTAP